MDLFNAAMEVASTLHPAVAVLNAILKELQTVQLNKKKLKHLIDRCRRVIVAIDEELGKRPPSNVDSSIRQLVRHLSSIRDMIHNLARLGYLQSMMKKEDIARQILDGHQRLTDCLALFQITAAVDVCEYMGALGRAAEEDREALYAQLRVLERNDYEVMRRFDVMQNQVEAMMAIQNSLLQKMDNSPEQRILKVGLKVLQKSSGQKLPIKRPEWSITRFDIEIDTDGQLGRGGFGSVKKGKWGKVVVAIKEITGATDYEMLIEEIEVWSQLRHDHILSFYGASAEASPPFIVSRYMANGHIMKFLSLHPDANRVQLVHEIALGMLYIHSKGIVHGDLKAVNVLIDDTTKACIADFGLSRVMQSHAYTRPSATSGTEHRRIAGTLRYMSPEALSGDISKMSDVYAFAMTLYEVFTNEPPFMLVPDSDLYELITKQHKRLTRPAEPNVINRGLVGGVWSLIWQASEPMPLDRPGFGEITEITERLAEDRLETLKEVIAETWEERSSCKLASQLGDVDRASPALEEEGLDVERLQADALSKRHSAELADSDPGPKPLFPGFSTAPLLMHTADDGMPKQGYGFVRTDRVLRTHDVPGHSTVPGLDILLRTGPSAYHLVPPMTPNGPRLSTPPAGNPVEPLISLVTGLSGHGLATQPPVNTRFEMNRLLSMTIATSGSTSESEAHRQGVILALLGKEERYLQRLNFLDSVFIKAIQHADPPVIASDDLHGFMTTVFWNISDLRDTSKHLLKKLHARQKEQQPNIQIIGDVLLEASKAFSHRYPSYIGHLPIARKRLQVECDRNPTFRSFLQRIAHHPDGRRLELWKFLTRPLEYIEYFPSLLEKLMRHTNSESTDVDFLYETGQVIRNISDLARLWTFQYGTCDVPDVSTSWNELVRRDVQEALSKDERKKQSIIFELISSEMAYVTDLEVIDKLYIQPLHDSTSAIFITQERLEAFIKQVFWNVTELRHHHKRFLERLLDAQRQEYPLINSVAAILCDAALNWREAYMKYIPHIPVAAYRIDQTLVENEAFRSFHEATLRHPSARRLPMKAFLQAPFPRLLRYNLILKSVLGTLPVDHPDVEALPPVMAILSELARVVDLSADMAKGRVNLWNYNKNLKFDSLKVLAQDMELMDATRLLIHEGRLLCQAAGEPSCFEVLVLVLDNFFVVTDPKREEGGSTKFHVKGRPLSIELLILEGLAEEPQLRPVITSTNVGSPGVGDRSDMPPKMLYPFSVRRLGETNSAWRFFAASAALRSEWGWKLREASSTRSVARETQKVLEVRSLCEDTFSTPLFDDASAHELSGDVPCLVKITCSVAFSTSDGRRMVAVGTTDGLWMGLYHETRALWRVLSLKMVTQCAMLEESGLFVVLADRTLLVYPIESLAPSPDQAVSAEKPLKLRDDVQFFSVGRLNDRPAIVYMNKKGAESVIRALEPLGRKAGDRPTGERRKSSATLSRTLSLFGDSRLEWFKTIREYVLWSNPFDVAFLETKIAILSPKGFEIMDLTDLRRVALPDWKDNRLAALPRREGARPMGIAQVNSNEYILCFDRFGTYVDHQGSLSRNHAIIEWEGRADRIAFHLPWIVIFTQHFVEVRGIDKGSGTINGRLSNCSARIHGVTSVVNDSDRKGQRVFELLPAPKRMSDRDEASMEPGSINSAQSRDMPSN